jgi:hypothetical protein
MAFGDLNKVFGGNVDAAGGGGSAAGLANASAKSAEATDFQEKIDKIKTDAQYKMKGTKVGTELVQTATG